MATPTPPRVRQGGGRLFVFVGLLMAVLAFALTIVIGGAIGGASRSGGQQVDVLVAADDIAFRTEIAATDLTTQKFAQSDVPPGAYLASHKNDVIHLTAEVAISKGQPILANMLAKSTDSISGLTTSYLPLPSGWVAYTITANEQQAVAGYPQAGDYINVIATVNTSTFGQSTNGQVTKLVFPFIHIIRVGPANGTAQPASQGGAGPSGQTTGGVTSSYTVELTECDAEYFTWLTKFADLKYTLISYKDYKPAPAAPDPSCPTVTSGHGVDANAANARWHFV